MHGGSLWQVALQRQHVLVVGGLLVVVISSWAYLLSGAGMLQEMDGMLMPMSTGEWSLGYALLMLLMWIVMMVAMMLPSAAPTILLYTTIAHKRHPATPRPGASTMFALGYVAVWCAFSLLAVSLQFALEQAALMSSMMEVTSIAVAGTLLVAAGVYQWMPLKQACLRHCRSPLDFIVTHWRDGVSGAFRMGARHGVYCLGCCWAMMLLLFVGGIMNLAWIAGLALFILLEKLVPAGQWIGRVAGLVLVAWGIAVLMAIPIPVS